jgi:hypothetical protein
LRVFALGQRLRHFADHIVTTAETANGERVRHWFQDKKAGWYAVLEDPQMPVISTLLDQAHNAIERKVFAMKGFHHPSGSQQALRSCEGIFSHFERTSLDIDGDNLPTIASLHLGTHLLFIDRRTEAGMLFFAETWLPPCHRVPPFLSAKIEQFSTYSTL